LQLPCLLVRFKDVSAPYAASSFAVSTSYYGLSLNANRLGGSIYLNAVYTALVETSSYGVALVILRRYSNRQLFFFSTGMCGLCLLFAPLAKSGEMQTTKNCFFVLYLYC